MKNSAGQEQERTPQVNVVSAEELAFDPNNANRGTPRGRKQIKNSLKRLGAGRSILIDKNNQVVAGNKTLDEARRQGFKKVVVVDTDGETLVAVRRTDLDLTTDKKARELAISDNRAGELDLSWDPEVLRQTDVDLSTMFEPIELDQLLNKGEGIKRTDKIDLQPPPKMIWILVGVPFNRFDLIQKPLAELESVADISVQQARSE